MFSKETEAPPPPPAPPQASQVILRDWRADITAIDRARYDRLSEAWQTALTQARSQPGSGDLALISSLIDPAAGLVDAGIPEGDYRCRTVKLGSQGGDDGLGYVVYGWFSCRISATPEGMRFVKLTGSQRPQGMLYPESNRRMVFLGTMVLSSESGPKNYGINAERDIVAVLERIGEARWRLISPWPTHESNLDVLELVPA